MEDKDGAVIPGVWSDIKWSINKKGKEQIKEIVELLKNSDRLILATDPDREGEAIAAHIAEEINKDVERVEFTEITKNAVMEAIKNSREINYN